MTSKIYNKPPLTLEQQAELLRNLVVDALGHIEIAVRFQHLNLVRNICAHYSRPNLSINMHHYNST